MWSRRSRDEAAHGELSRWLDALDSNDKGVTGLRFFHVDGTRLRIEKLGRSRGTAGENFLINYAASPGLWAPGKVEYIAVGFASNIDGPKFRSHTHPSWLTLEPVFPGWREDSGVFGNIASH